MHLIKSLALSLLDLFHPRMLLLLLVPPLISLILWLGLGFLFWSSFLSLTQNLSEQLLLAHEIPSWMSSWGDLNGQSVGTFVAYLIAVVIAMPLIFLTSLLLTSVIVMPQTINYMRRSFPEIEVKGQGALRASISNSIKSSIIYLGLWILSLPLWLTGIGFAIPLFLNGYLNYRIFAFDSLVDMATAVELRTLMRKKRIDYLLLGVITASFVIFPPAFLFLPIYTALCYTRYSFLLLQERRASTDRLLTDKVTAN